VESETKCGLLNVGLSANVRDGRSSIL